MTNHLEIKKELSWKFPEKSGIPYKFPFMPNRSSEQVLESSRRIEKSCANFQNVLYST